jgi:hypothetical protein
MLNFMKICWYVNDVTKIFPVGAMLFHAGEREGGRADTDMTKVTVTFRNSANKPKNGLV